LAIPSPLEGLTTVNSTTMNLLQKHFDLALDAPDGIKKLRELILTLAMQGKLVPQDPKDQPASELLKEIEAEKRRLVKEGKIKAPKPLLEIKPEDVPYAVPVGWEWVRLSSVFNIISGNSFDLSLEQEIGTVPYVKVGDMNFPGNELIITTSSRFIDPTDKMMNWIIPTGSIIFPKRGGAIATNKKRIIDTPVFVDLNTMAIIPMHGITTDFAYRWLLNLDLSELNTGTSVPQINHKDIEPLLFPLPPFAEQNRIVAKIDQLMATCDALEELRGRRQQKRLDIHTAVIHQILDPSVAPSRLRVENILFAHFGELYSVKENVVELRKAILQLAVMGKLVPQDPRDQPASELLKEIEAEKRRLVKEGKIKERGGGSRGDAEGAEIKPEDVPYAVPAGWEWVRLGEIVEVNGGFAFKSSKYVDEGIRVIRISDFDENGFKNEKIVRYTFSSELKSFKLSLDNILMAMTGGTVGKSYLVKEMPEPMIVNQRVATINICNPILPDYINGLIRSNLIQDRIQDAKNSTNDNISMADITGFIIPVPPLAEQKRIVAKIDQLMALCDRLEQGIDAGTKKQTQVLQSIITGAV
jgi:type I restriction enzyme S subunit